MCAWDQKLLLLSASMTTYNHLLKVFACAVDETREMGSFLHRWYGVRERVNKNKILMGMVRGHRQNELFSQNLSVSNVETTIHFQKKNTQTNLHKKPHTIEIGYRIC